MKLISLFFLSFFFIQEIPFKPKEEFDVKVDLKFKQRPSEDDRNTIHLSTDKPKRSSSDQLPYLNLRVTLIKLNPGETRFRITNNLDRKQVNKKIEKTPAITIDAGFTDDIKGKVNANEYIITLLTSEKANLSRIVIRIEEDGTFLVNGEKRGKF